MKYRESELILIGLLYDKGLNREAIAKRCNEVYHEGRPIRTARGIEFALGDKLKRSNDRFTIVCEICKTPFKSGWPNARYCSEDCRSVVDREYANRAYYANPKQNVQQQTLRARSRIKRRWTVILETKGDRCVKCKKTYPPVVYDLHHPNGKKSRKDSPSRIIRSGSEEDFNNMLQEVEVWCPICHRLYHAEIGDWAPMRKGM
jgi:hypothetical protein